MDFDEVIRARARELAAQEEERQRLRRETVNRQAKRIADQKAKAQQAKADRLEARRLCEALRDWAIRNRIPPDVRTSILGNRSWLCGREERTRTYRTSSAEHLNPNMEMTEEYYVPVYISEKGTFYARPELQSVIDAIAKHVQASGKPWP